MLQSAEAQGDLDADYELADLFDDVSQYAMQGTFQSSDYYESRGHLRYALSWGGFPWARDVMERMIDPESGRIRDIAPWIGLLTYLQSKFSGRFGDQFLLNLHREWRAQQVGILDTTIMAATLSRRIFFTEGGRIGLGPAHMQESHYSLDALRTVWDNVFFIDGAHTPFILRRRENGVQIVGGCYLHGEMDGADLSGDWQSIKLV
jgi:hypothetical protein